ncbi:hypothetical protein B0H10DRAFT_2133449, partial [Mycena sp. CBHHK59/15]
TRKRPSTAQHGSDGMFISNHKLPPAQILGPSPTMTFDERAEKCAAQRKRAEEKHRITEMRGAEQREAGDNIKGKEKRKKLREDFQKGLLRISQAEFDRQMQALQPKTADSSKANPTWSICSRNAQVRGKDDRV